MKDSAVIKKASPFGQWLREKRTAKGWSMRELADRSDGVCTAGYIGQLEKGDYAGKKGKAMQPSEKIVEKLALALGESINEARNLAEYQNLNQTEEERIKTEFTHTLHKYHRLSSLSRSFANRHFSETINFLLDVEGGSSPPLSLVSESDDAEDDRDRENCPEPNDSEAVEDFTNFDRELELLEQNSIVDDLINPEINIEKATQEDKDEIPTLHYRKGKITDGKKKKPS